LFSTLLGGYASMEGAWHQTDEPQVFQEQNWAAAIALDRAGNLVVAGGTRASHFLSADGTGPGRGGADAFVATIPADGSRLLDPAFFGGSENDGVTALAIDGQGNAVAGGISSSPDFMGRGGSGAAGGFVVRLGGRAQGGPRMRRR
jgi:hypothetical protein